MELIVLEYFIVGFWLYVMTMVLLYYKFNKVKKVPVSVSVLPLLYSLWVVADTVSEVLVENPQALHIGVGFYAKSVAHLRVGLICTLVLICCDVLMALRENWKRNG
jgi:hypothetical protein